MASHDPSESPDNHEQETITALRHQVKELQEEIDGLKQSLSWKVTGPLRFLGKCYHMRDAFMRKSHYRNAWHILRQSGARATIRHIQARINGRTHQQQDGQKAYQRWIAQYDVLSDADRTKMQAEIESLKHTPLISVVMPVYNAEEQHLREAIESVRTQVYPHWELCIADDASTRLYVKQVLEAYEEQDRRIKVVYRRQNGHISEASNSALEISEGDYIALLDHDDRLAPHALYHVAKAINEDPSRKVIYSDEDKLDEAGIRHDPYFKSDWNEELFYGQNMVNHLGVYHHDVIAAIGGFRAGVEGSQDYDLMLRALREVDEEAIHHIPKVLYHWRLTKDSTAKDISNKAYAKKAAKQAIQEHLDKTRPGAKVVPAWRDDFQRVLWPLPEVLPLVTIIIPTRDKPELLKPCVESIMEHTKYERYEILIVDNQTTDPETLEYFRHMQIMHKQIRVLPYPYPFNYAAINNKAVEEARGSLVLFMNNDVEVMGRRHNHRCWLTEMVSQISREKVGAVGAKLYFTDKTVQHAGIILDAGAQEEAVASHAFYRHGQHDPGYFSWLLLARQCSAVTGACMMTSKALFQYAGGFDAEQLPVAYNDIDYCLKLRKAGKRIVWTPYAELYHHESVSRGGENSAEKQQRFRKETEVMRARWAETLDDDPFYNPNLSLLPADFTPAFPPRKRK